jgi:hypothetical protein
VVNFGVAVNEPLLQLGRAVAEAVRQIGTGLLAVGAADQAAVQAVEASVNAIIAARAQLLAGVQEQGLGQGVVMWWTVKHVISSCLS